jgi:hypothetical protein
MLVYFGGVKDLWANGTVTGQPITEIFLYDLLNRRWYMQSATGGVPEMRRRFCAGVTWPPDQSSYNMWSPVLSASDLGVQADMRA